MVSKTLLNGKHSRSR